MNRRKFIAGAGGIGAATIGAVALSGSAAAASVDGSFDNGSASATTADGEFDHINVEANDVEFGYKGLDDEAHFAIITLSSSRAAKDSEDYQLINYAVPGGLTGQEATGLQIEEHEEQEGVDESSISGDLLEFTDWDAADFEANNDGDTNKTDVPLRLDVWVFFGDAFEGARSDAEDVAGSVDLSDETYTPDHAMNFLTGEDGVEGENFVHAYEEATVHIDLTNEEGVTGTSAEAGAEIGTNQED